MNSIKYRLSILILLILSLSSCLTMTSILRQSSDGSGSISLDYRLNRKALGVQKDSINNDNLIPLPVSEQNYINHITNNPNMVLNSYSETEDNDYLYIQAEISYQNVSDLEAVLGLPITLDQRGNRNVLTVFLYDADQPLNERSQAILNSVFDNDSLSLELNLPRTVLSSSHGRISGRTVSLDVPVRALYTQNSYIWTVEW